jgi:hypothetical protein
MYSHCRKAAFLAAICLVATVMIAAIACSAPRRSITVITPTPQALPALPLAPVPTPTPPTRRFLMPLIRQPGASATPEPAPSATPEPTIKTQAPKPSPTPTLPWPEALDRPPNSKLGIHVQWNNSAEIMEYVRRMKPRVVKSIGDYGFFAEIKQASPSTILLARVQAPFALDGDPVQAARAYVQQHINTYLANPAVDYWEGPNEPDVKGRMDWYAAFEAERVRLMAAYGLKVAIGSFSTGVPEWDEFGAFVPAVREAKAHGGILSLHEYDAPTMDRSAGAGLPGHPNHPDRGALTLRYRWWYEDFLKPQGLAIPLVISEAGVDGLVANRPGPQKGRGWRDFAGYWQEQGLGDDGIKAYLNQLAWYDSELRKDSYVIGCTLFTAGAMNDDWKSYDITSILRHIATFLIVPSAQ